MIFALLSLTAPPIIEFSCEVRKILITAEDIPDPVKIKNEIIKMLNISNALSLIFFLNDIFLKKIVPKIESTYIDLCWNTKAIEIEYDISFCNLVCA